jgi:cytochrome c peroxidase
MVWIWVTILTCLAAGIGVWAQSGASEPVTPLEPPAQLDPAKVDLGRRLFGDPRLSHDNVFSCSACHDLRTGGDDGRARSPGVGGWPLDFNTPTIFNVSGNSRLNWRGNFRALEEQNESVLLNAQIMNTSWEELLAKLRGEPGYRKDFKAIYAGDPARASVLDALATFERSLVTPNSRFDRWLRGAREAMSPEEEHGYQLFKSYGCVACHQGANFGGNLFQQFGIFEDPFKQPANAENGQGDSTTGAASDKPLFRVPSLRNVAVTAPYFHNGYTASLAQAVEIMARSQLGRELPREDVGLIVQFLNTLTGEYEGRRLEDAVRGPQ